MLVAGAGRKQTPSWADQGSLVALAPDRVADLLMRARSSDTAVSTAARDDLVSMHFDLARQLVAHLKLSVEQEEVAFQEACLGITVGVIEYVERGGDAAAISPYVARVAGLYLDTALAQGKEQARADQALAADVARLERLTLELVADMGREPSPLELDAALGWTGQYREMVEGLLEQARRRHDEALVPFLDPESGATAEE